MSITIVNYGLGNLNSIKNIIKRVGGEASICSDPSNVKNVTKLILPGVGAFDQGMAGLIDGGWIDVLNELVLIKKIPVLGICLGMQLMCKSSEEGNTTGLGWINAVVKRFNLLPESKLKIPHMGWNTIDVVKSNPLILNNEGQQRFYFVHSFHAECLNKEDILATTHHGGEIVAAFSRNDIFGVQFHPEKSHRFGLSLMKKFNEL